MSTVPSNVLIQCNIIISLCSFKQADLAFVHKTGIEMHFYIPDDNWTPLTEAISRLFTAYVLLF